jgi:hypothetical protein
MALAHDAATAGERITAEAYTQFADHYFRLHQAAVGVAETKRLQDQASNATDHGNDDAYKPAADESGAVNAEGSATEAVADEAVAPVAPPRSQRSAGRGRPANSKANGSDADETERDKANTPAGDTLTVDTLTPAQLAEVVQTDQDKKEAS